MEKEDLYFEDTNVPREQMSQQIHTVIRHEE